MRIVDLTHGVNRKNVTGDVIPVVVRSADPISRIALDDLVTLATVVDLTDRADETEISLGDISKTGVADIGGCILHTDWCDHYISGLRTKSPVLTIGAASYLLQGGVRTIASDFPITTEAADLLIHNNCILVHCLSNIGELCKSIVRLVALPLKVDDVYSAEARVIAIEE
ncbi:cyclase family protein [bacterium]|nr:cyclase family protein [bacterium]